MSAVSPGIAQLAAQEFAPLKGLNVGLVTNATGILPDGKTSTVDALYRAPGVKLTALFGPEHGVRGDVPAGKYVASYTDKKTGLPVYSLYGATKVPTAAMLKGLSVLLFDIQDIGCRSYTYLSTLGAVLDGAAQHGIPVIICDRPNLLGGVRVEGGPPRSGYFSFIGAYPLAYRHGLTLGEAGQMLQGKGYLKSKRRLDLKVILCGGVTRDQAGWDRFGGLPWVPTSPNIPTPDAAVLYAVTGIIGELSSVSIGIGTDAPFAYCGAPGVDAQRMIEALNKYELAGIRFQTASWTPRKGTYQGKNCSGVRIGVADMNTAELCRVNFALLCALRSASSLKLFADKGLFDQACGTNAVRSAFLAGASEKDLWAEFQRGAAEFAAARKPFLLY